MTTLSSPISSQPREQRPRPISHMSYNSTRSRRSSHSNKLDLTESARDKRRLEGKADPTKALSEAQPAVVALEDSNLDDLRMMQHKDREGNVITDPDRSNPTRNRLERPLDTIRSFNAAAEGTTSRRSSYQNRPPPQFGNDAGRRSSYYGSPGSALSTTPGRPRPGFGGYYRNNSYGFRPEAYAEEGMQQQHQPQQFHQPPYGRPVRHPNGPYYGPGESPSSTHSHQHSYETMTSGSDDYSKSTNPSSQNSSFDRLHQAGLRKPDEYNRNGVLDQENLSPVTSNGYRPPPSSFNRNSNYGPQSHRNGGPAPAPPPKEPIRLDGFATSPSPTMSPPTKRQSWLKRKFSRREN